MKRILFSICIGSLALAFAAQGAENNDVQRAKAARKASAAQNTASVNTSRAARVGMQRGVSTERFRQRSYHVTPQTNSAAVVHQNRLRNDRVRTFQNATVSDNAVRARNDVRLNRTRHFNVDRARTFEVNRDRNLTVNRVRNFNRERNITVSRERNITVNNNWRGERFSGQRYAAFRNYRREWHDRDWWRGHCDRIIFVSGGWYFWNAGYWYPAWGYDPGSYYSYDGPIYGYNNLAPDQIVINVQLQLQRDGYYVGPIDGVLGRMTRQAIADFQADQGLAVTAAIDQPTLATLGLG